jgi:hypothetical protein
MTDTATAALDVVRNALAAAQHETITQAALRRIEQYLATDGAAPETLVRQTMVALTLDVSRANEAPTWARVFEAAQLATGLPDFVRALGVGRAVLSECVHGDESLAMLDAVIASAKRAGF